MSTETGTTEIVANEVALNADEKFSVRDSQYAITSAKEKVQQAEGSLLKLLQNIGVSKNIDLNLYIFDLDKLTFQLKK